MTSELDETADITVVIPTIPPRHQELARALQSVHAQRLKPVAINVHEDRERRGAAENRDLAVGDAATKYLAFLDDDDEFYINHLQVLYTRAESTGADLVYPWFDVVGGTDPFPHLKFKEWDDTEPHQVPITFLVRTDAYREVGGFSYDWDSTQGEDPGVDRDGNRAGEDYRFILRLVSAGKKIVHVPAITWSWSHWSGNTSGLPSRW